MALLQKRAQLFNFLLFAGYLLSFTAATTTGECKPSTWSKSGVQASNPTPGVERIKSKNGSASVANLGQAKPGEVNCRYAGGTGANVDSSTCAQLVKKYQMTSLEIFFILNPGVDSDCGNIEPHTDYCVKGFIEPFRAWDGRCGPPNKGATCLGMDMGQCCNSETWTCGEEPADCAQGVCFDGACWGDKIWGTDGTCGAHYGNRLCAGKWGECCSMDGKCGTGPDFCGKDVCQSGNCIKTPGVPFPAPPPWVAGNTTDGTCGGDNHYTCNVVFGKCCNKDGLCGSTIWDCDKGCQSQFGKCGYREAVFGGAPWPTTMSTTATKVWKEPRET